MIVDCGNSDPFNEGERNFWSIANAPMISADVDDLSVSVFIVGSKDFGYRTEVIAANGNLQVLPDLTFAIMASTISGV